MKFNFARSAAIESMLKREGVKFKMDPEHPVRKFNLETSKKQNAREKGIDDALVEKYIISLLKGDPFPYVVGVINPEKVTEELLIGGLHTTTSVVDPRCNGETVGAYIIDYVPSKRYLIFKSLPFLLNTTGGENIPDQSQFKAAARDVVNDLRTLTDAAEAYSLPKEQLRTFIRVFGAKEDLTRASVPTDVIEGLTHEIVLMLKHVPMQAVKAKAAKIALASGIKAADFKTLIARLTRVPSEAAQLKMLDDEQKLIVDLARVTRRKHTETTKNSVPVNFRKHVTSFERFMGVNNIRSWTDTQITDPEIAKQIMPLLLGINRRIENIIHTVPTLRTPPSK